MIITRILACQLTESLRVTPESLCTLLGLKNDPTWLHFLKNNNLQDSHNGLRGVLILIDYEVGLIVRSAGTHVLLQVLLPRSDRPQWKLVDLSQGNFHYGFFCNKSKAHWWVNLLAHLVKGASHIHICWKATCTWTQQALIAFSQCHSIIFPK